MALTDKRVIELSFVVNNNRLNTSLNQSTQQLDKFGKTAETSGAAAAAGVERTTVAINGLAPALSTAKNALLGFFAVQQVGQLTKDLIGLSDTYANLLGRLKLATAGQQDLNSALETVFNIAQDARAPFDALANLYGKASISAREFNRSQEDAAKLTEIVAKSFKISGTAAAEQEGAIRQLVQALQSGVLRGEEFNSVNEQAPRLMRALADGLQLPIGRLKDLASQGKLTTDALFTALVGQADVIDKEFQQLPITVGESLTKLRNAILKFVGEGDQGVGVTRGIAAAILTLAENIEILTPIIEIALVGGLLKAAQAGLAYIQVSRQKTAAAKAEAVATAQAAAEAQKQAQIEAAAAELRAKARLRSAQAALAANKAEQAALREQIVAQNASLSAAIRAGQANEQYAVSLRASIASLNQQAIAAKENSLALSQQAIAAERAAVAAEATAAGMNTAATSASLLSRALGLLGNVVNLAFAGFIGFEIGTYLYDQFTIARQAGVLFVELFEKAGSAVTFFREALAAPFNDDTIQAAYDRHLERLNDIDAITDDLFEQAKQKPQEAGNALSGYTDSLSAAEQETKNLGAGLVKLQDQFGQLASNAETSTKIIESQAKADKARAESLLQIIELGGDELEILKARVAAADANVKSSASLATAREREADLAEQALAAIREELSGRAELSDAQKKAVTEAEQEAESKRALADAARETAEQAINQANAARITEQVNKDNAGSVKELAAAYDEARKATELLIESQRLGTATTEQVTNARRREAESLALYRDALNDSVSAAERALQTRERETDAAGRAFDARIAEAEAAEQVARAAGDENAARQARLRVLQLEAQQATAVAAARKAEASAAEALAVKIRQLAAADGEITAAEAESIAKAEENIEIKRNQAAVAESNAKAKRAEASAATDNTEAISAETQATEELKQAQDQAAKSAADLAAASGFINQIIGIQEERLSSLSEKAKEAFQDSLTGGAVQAANAIDTTNEKLQNANDRVIEAIRLQSASNGVFTQIAGYYQELSASIEVATLRQKGAVEQLIRGLESGSQAAFAQLRGIGADIDSLRNRFDLLDDADLNSLLNSLQQINNEIDKSADKVTSLRQRLAQLRGDEVESQRLQNQKAILDLERELAAARQRGNAEEIRNLEEALRLQTEINKEELKRAKQKEENPERRFVEENTDTTSSGGGGAGRPNDNVIPLRIQPEEIKQPLQEVSNDFGNKLDRFVNVLDQRDQVERQHREQDRQQLSRSGGIGGATIIVPVRDTEVQRAAFSGSFYTKYIEPAQQRQARLSL